jgi:ribosomal protein L11 methylase PrmA
MTTRIALSILLAVAFGFADRPGTDERTALASAEIEVQAPKRLPDIHYVPTPPAVVDGMLKLAGVTSADVVYDLGSGDGRIPIAAAKTYGARGVGIDLDPKRVAEANRNARQAGVADKVTFIEGDMFEADISPATVVTLYLLTAINEKLRPKLLRELKPGARIVSHWFRMGDWEPDTMASIEKRPVWLWRVPPR